MPKIEQPVLGAILMTETQVEVINSVRRRRRWSRAEKERIVAAAMEPGAVASAVAREAGIQASQLVRWRQQLQGAPPLGSITVQIPSDVSPIATLPMPSGVIEVELASGVRLQISGAVDAPVVSGGHESSGRLRPTLRGPSYFSVTTAKLKHRAPQRMVVRSPRLRLPHKPRPVLI